MKLPVSDKVAALTPACDVLEVQTMAESSERTRFPVLSSSTTAAFVTGEFLYMDLERK